MKKVFAIFAIVTLAACGGASTAPTADSTAVVADSAAVVTDSTAAGTATPTVAAEPATK